MHLGFWKDLKNTGFVGLSPMDGVTDDIYRTMMAREGAKPIFTEFNAVEGLARNAVKLLEFFEYDGSIERPVVAQVFGIEPESFYSVAVMVAHLGYDGIDINMGCPSKKVEHRGAGAGLIRNPELAGEIIRATQKGVQDYAEGKVTIADLGLKQKMLDAIEEIVAKNQDIDRPRLIPVSVKTRLGHQTSDEMTGWIKHLLSFDIAALTLHGRTYKQMYMGQADWDKIAEAVQIRDSLGIDTVLIGNGDVQDRADADDKIQVSGVDGVLVGRATYGNPWLFSGKQPTIQDRIDLAIEHCQLFEERRGLTYFFAMRKHLGWYIKGISGAREMRTRLMQVNCTQEVRDILSEIV